jgi:quinol monooxygenase YgiN
MYARSTTIMANPGSIDRGVAYIRDEVMPTLMEMDGCIGLSMLVDRESGRCIATSAWRDEDAMRAGDAVLHPVRARVAEMLGGGMPQVEEWEIAALHRDHTSAQGACVRATWSRMSPDQTDRDRGVDFYKLRLLPSLEQFDGFCSASLLINRQAGMAVSSTTFDSRDAMDRSREQGQALRDQTMAELGTEVVDVCEFELALAHLRVPEMA